MMTIYDMNTGQIIESGQRKVTSDKPYAAGQQRQAEPHLQVVAPSCQTHKERGMPTALANVNPDAFLQRMG
jgi:hypothetical protein